VQIHAEVVRQDLVPEDVPNQPLVALREDQGVVLELRVLLPGPEIEKEAGHRVGLLHDLRVGPVLPMLRVDQLPVGVTHIGVGRDEVGVEPLPIGDGPDGAAVLDDDLLDFVLGADLAAELLEQTTVGLHQRIHPALAEPDPALAL